MNWFRDLGNSNNDLLNFNKIKIKIYYLLDGYGFRIFFLGSLGKI